MKRVKDRNMTPIGDFFEAENRFYGFSSLQKDRFDQICMSLI